MSLASLPPSRLFAKTLRREGELERFTIAGHTRHVGEAAIAIVDSVGAEVLSALGLATSELHMLRRTVVAGALLHDLGKANDNFQLMLARDPSVEGRQQKARHEALIITLAFAAPAFGAWLESLVPNRLERLMVLTTVAFHHLKFNAHTGYGISAEPRTLRAYLDHPDAAAAVDTIAQLLEGTSTPLPAITFEARDVAYRQSRQRFLEELEDVWRRLTTDHPCRLLLPLAKHLVAAADGAGSAVVKSAQNDSPERIGEFVRLALATRCGAAELDGVIAEALAGQEPRRFQLEVAQASGPVVLARAGCGAGKTLAAWMFLRRRAAGLKVIFAYPTTGTATEGFAGYVATSELEGRLIHSRSSIDIDLLDQAQGDLDQDEVRDQAARWEAFGAWSVAAIVTTADAVLGLLQNQPRSMYASPALLSAAYVFDEVHAYDRTMFGMLLRFLTVMRGAPILLMTASMPADRLEAIRHAAGELTVIDGPPERERALRYDLSYTQESQAVSEAVARYRAGGKVLWVVNTVAAARTAARALRAEGLDPLLYHSRFRYEDRARIHRQAVQRFAASGPTVLVATQVAEMSLDLSADLLISHCAPIPAMIQRLGRLNRRDPVIEVKSALFMRPEGALPYNQAELDLGHQWLEGLIGRPVAQRDLASRFEELQTGGEANFSIECNWLDDLAEARAGSVREAGHTVTVLMARDAQRARSQRAQRRRIVQESTIPMLLTEGILRMVRGWQRLDGVPVAPEDRITYDPFEGAAWAN